MTLGLLFLCTITVVHATDYYSKTTGDPSALGTWGTNSDGTGTAPTSFTTGTNKFILRAASSLTTGTWTLGSTVTLQMDGFLTIDQKKTVTINGTIIFNNPSVIQIALLYGPGNNNATFKLSADATLTTKNVNGIAGGSAGLGATGPSIQGNGSNSGNVVTLDPGANYEFNGDASQVTTGLPSTVKTLTINNAVGVNLSSIVTINTLTIGSITPNSIFKDNGNQVTAGTGTTINLTSGTFVLGSTTSPTSFPAFVTRFIAAATTVEYASNQPQNIAAIDYGGLKSSGSGARTLASTGIIGIAGTFTPGSNAYTTTGSTINFNGTTAQNVPAFSYFNLTASNTGTKTATGTLNIKNNLTVSGGTLDIGIWVADNTGSSGTRTISVANGATLRVGNGHILPQYYATYTFNLTSTVVFYGGGTRPILARTYGNLIIGDKDVNITDNTVVTATGNLNIAGDFTIGTGTIFNGTDGTNLTHRIQGNWTNNGFYNASGATHFSFDGSALQTIGGSKKTTFENLFINNASGITLNQTVEIGADGGNGTLTFDVNKGIINSSSANLLVFLDNSTVTGVSNLGFVNGPVRKIGNDPFVFPVGKTLASGTTAATGYNPISISTPSNPAVTTHAFTAEYFNAGARTASSTITAPGLDQVSACQYWILNRTNSTSTVDVTLSWKDNSKCTSSPYINDISTVVVAHSDGSTWDSYSRNGGTTGDATAGTVKWNDVSTFSPFTIGTTNGNLNPLPVTFTSFEGRKASVGTQLSWKVAGETFTQGYEIERKTTGGQFTKIGFVAATGSGSNYSFTDAAPQSGMVYYRLRNVSQDGRSNYSNILSFQNGRGAILFQVVPTVVYNRTTVQHSSAGNSAVLTLSDMTGKQVKLQKPQAGAIQTDVDMTGLRAGMYLLRFNDGNGSVQTVKLIKR